MMNKMNLLFVTLVLVAFGCGNGANEDKRPPAADLKKEIAQTDDSLKYYFKQVMDGKLETVPVFTLNKAIDQHLAFYRYYPKDKFAAECLDKAHQLYLQTKEYGSSVLTCDTLIAAYPKYKNRKDVYLSAASTCDYMLRDTTKAKTYYQLLLKSPGVDEETRENVAFRLKHLSMTFDEMIEFQMKQIESK